MKDALEVYDLTNDQSETKDISAANPDVIARLELVMKNEHTTSQYFKAPYHYSARKKKGNTGKK